MNIKKDEMNSNPNQTKPATQNFEKQQWVKGDKDVGRQTTHEQGAKVFDQGKADQIKNKQNDLKNLQNKRY